MCLLVLWIQSDLLLMNSILKPCIFSFFYVLTYMPLDGITCLYFILSVMQCRVVWLLREQVDKGVHFFPSKSALCRCYVGHYLKQWLRLCLEWVKTGRKTNFQVKIGCENWFHLFGIWSENRMDEKWVGPTKKIFISILRWKQSVDVKKKKNYFSILPSSAPKGDLMRTHPFFF